MPSYLVHLYFCLPVSLSICLELFSTIYQGKQAQACAPYAFPFVGTWVPPYFPVALPTLQQMLTVRMAPLLSPLNFLCSRSPSFIISPVSSETDCRSLPISLCLSVPASASRGVSVQGTSLISHAALRPYVERPLLTKEL